MDCENKIPGLTARYEAELVVRIKAEPFTVSELTFLGLLTESVMRCLTERWGSTVGFDMRQEITSLCDIDGRLVSEISLNTGLVPDMNWSGRFARETEVRWDGDDHIVGIEGVRDRFLDCLWDIDLNPLVAEAQEVSGVPGVWNGMVTAELKSLDIWKG